MLIMISIVKKKIFIIDFKTGYDYKQAQLDEYREVIENLDFVSANNYYVKAEFLVIDINQ